MAMEPFYWRSVKSKDAGRLRLTQHHRTDEMRKEKWWKEICGRENGELHFVHHETHTEWPNRERETTAVSDERRTACVTFHFVTVFEKCCLSATGDHVGPISTAADGWSSYLCNRSWAFPPDFFYYRLLELRHGGEPLALNLARQEGKILGNNFNADRWLMIEEIGLQ